MEKIDMAALAEVLAKRRDMLDQISGQLRQLEQLLRAHAAPEMHVMIDESTSIGWARERSGMRLVLSLLEGGTWVNRPMLECKADERLMMAPHLPKLLDQIKAKVKR